MDSIIDNIENLIHTLYSETRCNEKTFEETNKLLISLQQSKEAWIFAWILLNKQKSLNVQYFGASSLYLKLTKYHYELDSNSYGQIQWKIIENLINYMESSDFNLITTKLISCLAVSVVRNIDTTWNNSLQDIVNFFQPEKLAHIPPTRVIKILLEILCAIPDEFNNPYNDKNKKISVRTELIRHAESIIILIHKVLTEENISDELTKICLKCLSNWNVGLDYLDLIFSEPYSNIIELILNFVRNESTCHDSVECIIAIYTNPFTHKQPKLVLQLIEKMTICLRDVIDNHKANHNYLRDVYLLFCSIGEIHTRIILDSLIDLSINSEIVIGYFNVILKCSSTPNFFAFDETISDMPFSFWINFLDDLIASDEGKIQTYLNIFKDILNSLINIYLFKIQYPPDEIYEQIWDNDDRDKFRCYRQDVADTYAYCYTILKNSILEIFLEHFHIAFKQVMTVTSNTENDNNLVNSSIRYLEAVLFAFSTLTGNISNDENVFMPQILATFNLLPIQCLNCSLLLSTINSFLSSLSDWLNSNINYISFTLTIIKNSLKSSSTMVTISATLALKLITTDCQQNLSQFAYEIINICEEGFKYSNLDYRNKARLMHSLATILSIMPLEVIMQTIDRILLPLLAETENILAEKANTPATYVHIGGVLLILSNLFAQLDTKPKFSEFDNDDHNQENMNIQNKVTFSQPLYKIFEKVLPMFEIIVLNYSMYADIVQNLCECIKKTVMNLMDDVKAFVGNILHLLINLYQNANSIAVLNISRQLFILFYKDAQLLPSLQEYFYSLCNATIELFKSDFRENTFLVQNFYEECAQALRKATVVFLHPSLNHLPIIFEWAVAGILLPEKGTVHQCSVFISEFLNQGRHNEHFHKVIDEHFERLVIKVFIVIGGTQGSPSFAVDYMPDIIMALNQKYSDSFSRTLKAFIETDGFPTDIVNREQKIKFVQLITSSLRNNKRKLKEVVKEFSSQCRGLFGVDKR